MRKIHRSRIMWIGINNDEIVSFRNRIHYPFEISERPIGFTYSEIIYLRCYAFNGDNKQNCSHNLFVSYVIKATSSNECHCRNSSYYRSEEHTSELQSQSNLVCRLLLEKKKKKKIIKRIDTKI